MKRNKKFPSLDENIKEPNFFNNIKPKPHHISNNQALKPLEKSNNQPIIPEKLLIKNENETEPNQKNLSSIKYDLDILNSKPLKGPKYLLNNGKRTFVYLKIKGFIDYFDRKRKFLFEILSNETPLANLDEMYLKFHFISIS